jgi:hypothetical protein
MLIDIPDHLYGKKLQQHLFNTLYEHATAHYSTKERIATYLGCSVKKLRLWRNKSLIPTKEQKSLLNSLFKLTSGYRLCDSPNNYLAYWSNRLHKILVDNNTAPAIMG